MSLSKIDFENPNYICITCLISRRDGEYSGTFSTNGLKNVEPQIELKGDFWIQSG